MRVCVCVCVRVCVCVYELYYNIMAAGTELLLLNRRLDRAAQVLYRAVTVQHDTVVIRPLGATGVCTVKLLTPQNVVTVHSTMSDRDKLCVSV
jgi:hypothetical protein